MKIIFLPVYFFFLFIILVPIKNITAQGLTIGSGATFSLSTSALTLPGNWDNNGAFNAGTGTVIFNGTGVQTITSTDADTFYNLTADKSANNVQLLNDITVNGTLTLTNGRLDINSNLLTLGSSASLIESAGNILMGGEATSTRNLNSPASVNIMGAEITSTADFGSTVVTRGYAEHIAFGHKSIFRYYDITPANNSGLNATLVFRYSDVELNGLSEPELTLFRSTNSGTDWQPAGGILDTSANTVTLTGISEFSLWTLGSSSAPLPVELSSFNISTNGLNSLLEWTTATEVDNFGFEIERRLSPSPSLPTGQAGPKEGAYGLSFSKEWEVIAFVKGAGNSSSQKLYEYIDKNLSSGKYLYRLKQIDNDGSFNYSKEIEIEIGSAPSEFNLTQNYPNPFNPETMIKFTLNKSGNVTLKVYNTLGEEVASLFNGFAEAGKYYHIMFNASNLASGIYYARLQSGDNYSLKKMSYLK